eukprot:55527_1
MVMTRGKNKRKAAPPLVTNPFEAAKRKKSTRHKPSTKKSAEADKQSMPPPPKKKPVIQRTNTNQSTFCSALQFDSQTQDGLDVPQDNSNPAAESQQSPSWLQYRRMDSSQSIDYLTPMDNGEPSPHHCSSQLDILNNRIFNHTKSKITLPTNDEQKEQKEVYTNHDTNAKTTYLSRKDLKIPSMNEYLDSNEAIDALSYKKEQKGIVLADRYHVHYHEVQVLGNGSFGKVYKVRHRDDGCFYAIKKIKMQSIHQKNNKKYMKEGMILASLQRNGTLCSNIILYYTMWMQNSYFYLVTELCDHGNLYNLYKLRSELDEDIFCKIIQNISNALQYIHSQGYVHFDVKPENIFISKDFSFKLGDFGLCAKIIINDGNKENIPKFVEGDSRYLSRELIEESYNISELDKIDIFALGLSVFEMIISDNLPSNGFKWQQIRNGNLSWNKSQIKITNNMKQLIHTMIHSNPNERPSSKQLNVFLRKFNDELLQEKENQIQNLNKKIKILMHRMQQIC